MIREIHVWLKAVSKPLVHKGVKNAFTAEKFYCVDDGAIVHKYPIEMIAKVLEWGGSSGTE